MKTHNFAGVEVSVDLDVLTPALAFEARHDIWPRRDLNIEAFRSMSLEEQSAVIKRIKLALEVMHDNVETWLPAGFSFNEVGTCLNINYSLIVTDIEADIARESLTTTQKILETREELEQMALNWDEDETVDS